ncbi:MAG: RNA-binding S4 domain-containing protein [Clostridia bacterium]|nr:RNA-binding S4 domain-containing protein [Clostridia bacterium]
MEELPIKTEFIKLDQALKFSGIAETGGHAKEIIEKGAVRVNGEVCLSRGKKLYPGDAFEYKNVKFVIEN